MNQRDVAMKHGVPQATLRDLLKQRKTVTTVSDGNRKQMCTGKAHVVEVALAKQTCYAWSHYWKIVYNTFKHSVK